MELWVRSVLDSVMIRLMEWSILIPVSTSNWYNIVAYWTQKPCWINFGWGYNEVALFQVPDRMGSGCIGADWTQACSFRSWAQNNQSKELDSFLLKRLKNPQCRGISWKEFVSDGIKTYQATLTETACSFKSCQSFFWMQYLQVILECIKYSTTWYLVLDRSHRARRAAETFSCQNFNLFRWQWGLESNELKQCAFINA